MNLLFSFAVRARACVCASWAPVCAWPPEAANCDFRYSPRTIFNFETKDGKTETVTQMKIDWMIVASAQLSQLNPFSVSSLWEQANQRDLTLLCLLLASTHPLFSAAKNTPLTVTECNLNTRCHFYKYWLLLLLLLFFTLIVCFYTFCISKTF